jgi:signal transduction histidine kinase
VQKLEELDPEKTLLLAQRVESLAAVAVGIAHDLMSVLASVSMSLELITPSLPPADAWLAETLSEGIRRSKDGVRQIYWLASAQAGEPLFYDPLHLVKDARKLMTQALPGVEVSADYPPEVGLVHGDPSHLRQLLIGLCLEAAAGLEGEGSVTLRASRVEAGAAGGGEPGGARARFEIESRGRPLAQRSEPLEWRDRPAMAALLSAFAHEGGTVAGEGHGPLGFDVRIELPVAAAPEGASR